MVFVQLQGIDPNEGQQVVSVQPGHVMRVHPVSEEDMPDEMKEGKAALRLPDGTGYVVMDPYEEVAQEVGEGIEIRAHYTDSDPRTETVYPGYITLVTDAHEPLTEKLVGDPKAVIRFPDESTVATAETQMEIIQRIEEFTGTARSELVPVPSMQAVPVYFR